METKRLGSQTLQYANPPKILAGASIVGDVEGEGPLGQAFDIVLEDDLWGQDTWEKAECKMFEQAVRVALEKARLPVEQLNMLLGGDLLNQTISANFAARALNVPFIGLYNACSTITEALMLASALIDGGFAENAACAASSHFSTAERQYRHPLELGAPRSPTSQRTVTGAGAFLLGNGETEAQPPVLVTMGTIGKVKDLGVTDPSNMGAAMAPAAADTIRAHLLDTKRTLEDYDLIVTGDLGDHGTDMMRELLVKSDIDVAGRHVDCGSIIFGHDQDVHAGGSGCGCCAVTLIAHFLPGMLRGEYSRILVVATGALLSTSSSMQGESIPGISHAVVLERGV